MSAVLLLGFGGPTEPEDVRPFVEGVVRGRNVPPSRVNEVIRQYEVIGGRSPLNQLTFEQAHRLQELLLKDGNNSRVYVGMLHWKPYIEEVVQSMVTDGITQATVIILAPYRCEASFSRYVNRLNQAITKIQPAGITVNFVKPWHKEVLFIEAVSDRVQAALAQLHNSELSSMEVLFVAHSVPNEMEGSSNYLKQIGETAELVTRKCNLQNWQLVFQSRSGISTDNWLSPDVKDAIRDTNETGYRTVLIVPIGFVSDHVEVLYDLDVQAYQVAQELGMKIVRAETVGSHASFIKMLARITYLNSL